MTRLVNTGFINTCSFEDTRVTLSQSVIDIETQKRLGIKTSLSCVKYEVYQATS